MRKLVTRPHLPHLHLYLDTADVSVWESWLPTGLFHGVTCNPTLLESAGVACGVYTLRSLAKHALAMGAQEVHLQAWGASARELIEVGEALSRSDHRILVKLPATQAGTTAAKVLIGQDIPVTLTAVYEVHQVLMAAALGASYVAPYLGRISDTGRDGRAVLTKMQQILNAVGSKTRILTASIRDIEDISALAAEGLDTFTFSEAIAQAFFDVPATLKATEDFERAVERMTDSE